MKKGGLSFQLEKFPSDLSSDHSPLLYKTASQISPPKYFISTDSKNFENDMKCIPISLSEIMSEDQKNNQIRKITNLITVSFNEN